MTTPQPAFETTVELYNNYRDMQQGMKRMQARGWVVIGSPQAIDQGYGCMKTCCLGALFLPLALLGRKPQKYQVTYQQARTYQQISQPAALINSSEEQKPSEEYQPISSETNTLLQSDPEPNRKQRSKTLKLFLFVIISVILVIAALCICNILISAIPSSITFTP